MDDITGPGGRLNVKGAAAFWRIVSLRLTLGLLMLLAILSGLLTLGSGCGERGNHDSLRGVPQWSPDGNHIVFDNYRNYDGIILGDIYIVRSDGSWLERIDGSWLEGYRSPAGPMTTGRTFHPTARESCTPLHTVTPSIGATLKSRLPNWMARTGAGLRKTVCGTAIRHGRRTESG